MELKKKAEQYIMDAMDWRVEFGNLTRKEIPEIPLDAIREAITNSFGHRMFDSGQSNEITILKIESRYIIRVPFQQIKHRKVM